MEFEFYLAEQIKKHPSMMPRDIAKMCYQAAMGAEHLLADISAAKRYFDAEFDATEARDSELFECLSDDICRVDLGAWKSAKMPAEWLFNMFVGTATVSRGGRDILEEYLDRVKLVLKETSIGFSTEEWDRFLEGYRSAGLPAIHHGEEYRAKEKPAYRIVERSFLDCLPVLIKVSRLPINNDRARVIAIDGRAASGKTTLADKLSAIIGADIVRADDFFLPPCKRVAERLEEAGGNIDYERFCEEIIPNVSENKAFSYGIFDCSKMDISGERKIDGGKWRIVEGSYSHHPKFGNYADLRVFCSVDSEEQMRRILVRNGEKWAERFKNEWIPMEEKYFDNFKICEKSDVILQNHA